MNSILRMDYVRHVLESIWATHVTSFVSPLQTLTRYSVLSPHISFYVLFYIWFKSLHYQNFLHLGLLQYGRHYKVHLLVNFILCSFCIKQHMSACNLSPYWIDASEIAFSFCLWYFLSSNWISKLLIDVSGALHNPKYCPGLGWRGISIPFSMSYKIVTYWASQLSMMSC